MKKKGSFLIAYLCLFCFAVLGFTILVFSEKEERISDAENRMLQGFPTLSADTLLDGSFMNDFENFVSDAFPGRDGVITLSNSIMGFFGSVDEDAALKEEIEKETGGEEDALAAETAGYALYAAQTEQIAAESGSAAPAEKPVKTPDSEYTMVAADGSRTVLNRFKGEYVEYVAGVLNQYRECLPEDGTVHVINAPVSTDANRLYMRHYFTDCIYTLDDAMQPLLDEGVYFYDPFDIFDPYADEDLFSTDDHHWHAIGALHAANAMLENVGYWPADFYEYDYWLGDSIKNGPYRSEQLMSMKLKRENLKVMNPIAPVDAYQVSHLTERTDGLFLDFKYHQYAMYIGGPHGPYRLFLTGSHTGRSALVIGDSDSWAFIPYLTPYYDELLTTDPRNTTYVTAEVGASIRQYIEEYDIDDVYIITCTMSEFNDAVFSWRLETFLNTDYGQLGK